jgi:hypothetical protein
VPVGPGPDGAPEQSAEAAVAAPHAPAALHGPVVPVGRAVPHGPAAPDGPVGPVGRAVPHGPAGPARQAAVERGLPPQALAEPASARPGPREQAPGERVSAGPAPREPESAPATREPELHAALAVPVRPAAVVAPAGRALPGAPERPVQALLMAGLVAQESPGCRGPELRVGSPVSARLAAPQQGSASPDSVNRPSVGWPPAQGLFPVPRWPASALLAV